MVRRIWCAEYGVPNMVCLYLAAFEGELAGAPALAFFVGVRNNPVGAVMRLVCGLAIMLGLSFPAAGMAWQQDEANSASTAGQASAPPAPAESTPAQNSPAPAEKPQTESAPAGEVPAGEVPPETQPAAKPNTPESVAKKKAEAGTANGAKKRRKREAPAPDGTPRKIVVRQGGASEPAAQIAPDVTPAEAARERRGAEQLLGATGDQLKQLAGRTLDAQQQETAGQIRNYMDGSRRALQEGDVRRASMLAQKAHLLAEDLVKH
jgi:hypothetical protein